MCNKYVSCVLFDIKTVAFNNNSNNNNNFISRG